MQFACIAPTAYLDQYAGRGHFQLCLAQVAMRDAKYFEWYRRRRELGDFVILDNGAYEGELVTPSELLRVAAEIKPSLLTIPDKINNADESRRLAADFMTYTINFPVMRVLQNESRNLLDWMSMIRSFKTLPDWFALPRVLGEFRVQVALHLANSYAGGLVHAFGWTGNLNEVRALAKLGVTSIDTSAPVWRGLHNYKLLDTVDQAWEIQSGTPFDASNDGRLPNDINAMIESNLQSMQRACVAF